MATEIEQIEATESKTLAFLEELIKKNPEHNYHGAAVIAMSALDIDAEMRNPNSQIRKDFLAAIEIQDFIAFINNVLLPEIVKKDMEIREMLEDMEIYVKSKPGQPLSIEDFNSIQLPIQDAKQIEPLRKLLDDVKKLEDLTQKLQQLEIDWRIEKINFVKEKLEGALKRVEEKINTLPDEDPQKKELIDSANELKKDIVELSHLKYDLQMFKEKENNHTDDLGLNDKYDHHLSSISEKLTKSMNSEMSSLGHDLHKGLEDIDSKRIIEYRSKLQEISTLENGIKNSIEKFEDTFGKKLGLGDTFKQFTSDQNHNLTLLKHTLSLDIPHEKAHDSNHFKK